MAGHRPPPRGMAKGLAVTMHPDAVSASLLYHAAKFLGRK
jgi:hypothetical protein